MKPHGALWAGRKVVTGHTNPPCGLQENVPARAQDPTLVKTDEQEKQGQVYDFSQVRVRLVIEGQHAQDYDTDKVITVTINLPQVQERPEVQDSRELRVLTVIRIVREVETSTLLHCRFVEALPNELVPLYQSLRLAETAEAP